MLNNLKFIWEKEPTMHFDVKTREEILAAIRGLKQEMGGLKKILSKELVFDDHTVPRSGNNKNQAMGQMQRDVYIYLIIPIIRK